MNKIKMSDMLTLPVKRVPGGMMPFLKDGNDEVLFVGDGYHVDACVLAINAYDANQQEIADLKAQLAKQEDVNNASLEVSVARTNVIVKERDELKAANSKLIAELSNISQACIGELAMGYKMDAQSIGSSIFEATGLTSEQLREQK